MSLFRATDSERNAIEFRLSATRDAAEQFFLKILATAHTSEPRVITVNKNAVYPTAFKELKEERNLPQDYELWLVKYLNTIVEQDHRFIKRLVKAVLGFFSVETAGRTLQG
jgi:IS6 family transposase